MLTNARLHRREGPGPKRQEYQGWESHSALGRQSPVIDTSSCRRGTECRLVPADWYGTLGDFRVVNEGLWTMKGNLGDHAVPTKRKEFLNGTLKNLTPPELKDPELGASVEGAI